VKYKINISKVLNWSTFLLINIIMLLYLSKVYDFSFKSDPIRFGALVLLICILFVRLFNLKGIINRISGIFIIFIIYLVYLVALIFLKEEYSISNLMNIVLFPLTFLCSYLMVINKIQFLKIKKFQYIFIFIIMLLYLYTKFFIGHHGGLMINSIYYLVLLLPFVLICEKKLLRNVMIFAILICVLISMKRTAFIAVIGSLILFFVLKREKQLNKKSGVKLKNILYIILGIILIYLIYSFISDKLGFNILDRFNNNNIDISSGRFDIYRMVLDDFYISDIFQMFFGHGYNSVVYLTGGLSAHNDFLEILYDFGIVGLMLYVFIYINLLSIYKVFKKNRYINSEAFLVSIFIFGVMCIASHLIFIPTYVVYLTLFWGLCINDFNNQLKKCLK